MKADVAADCLGIRKVILKDARPFSKELFIKLCHTIFYECFPLLRRKLSEISGPYP